MSQRIINSGKARLNKMAATLCLIGSSLLLPNVAEAQWYGYRHPHFSPQFLQPLDDELTPRELIHAVRSQGFNRPSRPVYHDEVAVLNAVAPDGQPVRITLDIYSGQILNLSLLARRQVTRVRPEPREEEPRRKRPQVVERSPEMRPPARRPVESAKPGGATPEKPTIVRRAPLLPPQPGKLPSGDKSTRTPEKPVTSQAPTNPSGVGSGTRDVPRRIEIAPPAQSEITTPPI